MTTLTFTQITAIALAAYFGSLPVLGHLVNEKTRSLSWVNPVGWLGIRWSTRLLITAVAVAVAVLWTWKATGS